VGISFGGINAVNDVSIVVERGEIVGLIGGNGAGKSTLLNCISGHLRPDTGSIVVLGQDVSTLAPEYRPYLGLTRTFQDALLFPGLTVRETLMAAMDRSDRSGTFGAVTGAPWVRAAEAGKRARAAEVLATFGLEDRADALTSELSTGMRRICDLAAVVAAGADVVLLDEPTAGLAQREVEAFGPLLRRLREVEGCSMLIVEHDMPLLMSLCDRIYCLEQGQVIAEGTPAEVRADPRVIASYLGTETAAIERSTSAGATARARTPVNGKRAKPATPKSNGARPRANDGDPGTTSIAEGAGETSGRSPQRRRTRPLSAAGATAGEPGGAEVTSKEGVR
jgi:ABC-type branched-subunit amino acid transport system ATPase component